MASEFGDPYKYPGTDTLRNKPGIRDADALQVYEYEQAASRTKELRSQPVQGRFDLPHMEAIHGHLFQDVYEWQSTELKPRACMTEKDEAWCERGFWAGIGQGCVESSSARA